MSKSEPQNIGSGPHDPDPPPPPDAVLQAIRDGATWEHGALHVAGASHWLHIERSGWVLRPWKNASNGCTVTRATFNALAKAAPHKTLGHTLGQRLGLVPREIGGQFVAEVTVCPGGPTDPDLTAA